MNKLRRVLIMAGGTGGHVFPGLTLGAYLRDHGVEVHWLGTARGLEAKLVPEANFYFHEITIGGIRGKGITTLLQAPFKIIQAIRQSRQIINKINPDVVVGMGGFASGPGGIASWICQRPLVIHEQNAKAGLTNKILSKLAYKVLEGFPNSFKPQAKVLTIGNPVRDDFKNLLSPNDRFANRPFPPLRLLVVGGSLGAHALNSLVPKVLSHLHNSSQIIVLHQTGDKNLEQTNQAYKELGFQPNILSANFDAREACTSTVHLTPFIKSMVHAYEWADMVLCRAGALTVAELCAIGLGAILVPYPYAVDDHQTINAQFMVEANAAICIQQKNLNAEKLCDILQDMIANPSKHIVMANAAYQLRKLEVTQQFFQVLESVHA